MEKWINKIHQGHALDVLKKMPKEFVDCVVTSPPYWALRLYKTKPVVWGGDVNCEHEWGKDVKAGGRVGSPWSSKSISKNVNFQNGGVKTNFCKKCSAWKGELGLEPTFDLYIKNLCDIFDQVKRVLKKTGTCFVNIGDTFYTKSGSAFLNDNISSNIRTKGTGIDRANELRGIPHEYMQEKSLVGIPFRFAIEMIKRGWILRNTIIWYKRSCMPSSVKDRFTIDFEYIFFFVKSKKYWFETQYEPLKWEDAKSVNAPGRFEGYGNPVYSGFEYDAKDYPLGRNKRCVWDVNTQPSSNYLCKHCDYYGKMKNVRLKKGYFSKEDFEEKVVVKCPSCNKETTTSHFAVFPPNLIEAPIRAGCPEFICKKCGKPREKIYERKKMPKWDKGGKIVIAQGGVGETSALRVGGDVYNKWREENPDIFKGYSDCGCNAGFIGGIVLDPFMGSGTTGVVALKQNKRFVGNELSFEYIKMANARLKPYREQRRLV